MVKDYITHAYINTILISTSLTSSKKDPQEQQNTFQNEVIIGMFVLNFRFVVVFFLI